MKKKPNKTEQDDFAKAVGAALKRAAKEARRLAKMHGQKIWVSIDGKVVGLDP